MKCPACHHTQFCSKEITAEITVSTCLSCGFLIGDIQHSETVKPEFSRINDEAYQQSIGKVRQHQAREILHFVQPYARVGGDWLDIGCSFGYLLLEARQSGFWVLGIEPDETAFLHAQNLVGEGAVLHALMSDSLRPDNSADIVSMLDVLEHIPVNDITDFARMVYRKLRANGLWIIKVPATEGLYFSLAHKLQCLGGRLMAGVIKRLWQSEYEYPHRVYFNQKSLQSFLEKNGFEVIKATYLAEVPNSTVINRLLMDNTIPRWQALLLVPVFYCINIIEKIRRKSDAMLVLARRAP